MILLLFKFPFLIIKTVGTFQPTKNLKAVFKHFIPCKWRCEESWWVSGGSWESHRRRLPCGGGEWRSWAVRSLRAPAAWSSRAKGLLCCTSAHAPYATARVYGPFRTNLYIYINIFLAHFNFILQSIFNETMFHSLYLCIREHQLLQIKIFQIEII